MSVCLLDEKESWEREGNMLEDWNWYFYLEIYS